MTFFSRLWPKIFKKRSKFIPVFPKQYVRAEVRMIKTARNLKEINQGVEDGFDPFILAIKPNPEIKHHIGLMRHKKYGTYSEFKQMRGDDVGDDYIMTHRIEYYPYFFEPHYAAYLLPKDIKVGEFVWLEDLIQDLEGDYVFCNVSRAKSGPACWTGERFILDLEFIKRRRSFILG